MPIKKNSGAFQKYFWYLSKKIPVPIRNISGTYQKKFWYAAEITCVLPRLGMNFFWADDSLEKMIVWPLFGRDKIVLLSGSSYYIFCYAEFADWLKRAKYRLTIK